jgi:hypothetical protein
MFYLRRQHKQKKFRFFFCASINNRTWIWPILILLSSSKLFQLYMDLGSNFLGRGVRPWVRGHDEARVDTASSGARVPQQRQEGTGPGRAECREPKPNSPVTAACG